MFFWQGARGGDDEAINYLQAIYLIPEQKFDRKTFDENFDPVVRGLCDKQEKPIGYTGRFVIIASESSIRDRVFDGIRDGIENEKKWRNLSKWVKRGLISLIGIDPPLAVVAIGAGYFWTRDDLKKFIAANVTIESRENNYLLSNLSSCKKTLSLQTEKGDLPARARDIPGMGTAALVDRETAAKYFKFPAANNKEWSVFVRCPGAEDCLIPFANFHKYLYETKMQSFINLCRYLGATRVIAKYGEKNAKGSSQGYKVDAGHKAVGEGSIEVHIDKDEMHKELAKYNFKWSGNTTVYPVRGYWLSVEPSWKAMYDSRMDLNNRIMECDVDFTYCDDYSVNVNTKLCFERAGFEVGVGTNHRFEESKEITWHFKVEFPPAEKIAGETKELD